MRRKKEFYDLDEFTQGLVEALFFIELPESAQKGGQFASGYDVPAAWATFSLADQGAIMAVSAEFQEANASHLVDYPAEAAGHDFWYTLTGQGCGYWENDHGTKDGCTALTAAVKALKSPQPFRAHGRWYLDGWADKRPSAEAEAAAAAERRRLDAQFPAPPYTLEVASPRGAPYGRPSVVTDTNAPHTLRLRRVPLVDGDYDPGGAYWGGPGPIWCAWNDTEMTTCRAATRAAAEASVLRVYPNARCVA